MSKSVVVSAESGAAAATTGGAAATGNQLRLDPTANCSVVARPDPLYHGVLLALCSAVLVLATLLSVRNRTQVVLPAVGIPLPELCLMHRLTGLGCPGCGMTRCFIALSHGDLAAAWTYNPAGLLLFAAVAFQVPFRVVQLWRIRRGLPELVTGWIAPILLGSLAVAMIGQWALRIIGVPI